jgi:ornithine decarboxylase
MKNSAKFILSKSKVIEKYNELKEICDIISYSFKTNRDVGYVLRDNTDSLFSIHSLSELDLINSNKKIIYFLQATNFEELDFLVKKEINKFVVDNINDLNVLINYMEKNKNSEKIELFLRMRLKEKTIHTGKFFVFGFYCSQINEIIPNLKEHKFISKIGIHFHRKTQNISEWSIETELTQILSEDVINAIDYINIGGGIPSVYKNFNCDNTKIIMQKIKNTKEWANSNNIKLITEPGRFIAAPSVKLETKILSIYNDNIIIGCSVYNGAMDTFVANIRLIIENELNENQGKPYTIKGITPDSLDIFRYRVFLNEPKTGDKIIFLNAGAYNYWTDFCGLEKIPTIIVD